MHALTPSPRCGHHYTHAQNLVWSVALSAWRSVVLDKVFFLDKVLFRQRNLIVIYFALTKQDTNGQELTVVLLDSEGIEAVTSEGSDDHCIFTLTILLASVLIYNSVGVPSRNDVDGLEYPFGEIFIY